MTARVRMVLRYFGILHTCSEIDDQFLKALPGIGNAGFLVIALDDGTSTDNAGKKNASRWKSTWSDGTDDDGR